ncbi:hypothetical protein GC163_13525 [bacterium]|nr:hypothetical protein [bacterium]
MWKSMITTAAVMGLVVAAGSTAEACAPVAVRTVVRAPVVVAPSPVVVNRAVVRAPVVVHPHAHVHGRAVVRY